MVEIVSTAKSQVHLCGVGIAKATTSAMLVGFITRPIQPTDLLLRQKLPEW